MLQLRLRAAEEDGIKAKGRLKVAMLLPQLGAEMGQAKAESREPISDIETSAEFIARRYGHA